MAKKRQKKKRKQPPLAQFPNSPLPRKDTAKKIAGHHPKKAWIYVLFFFLILSAAALVFYFFIPEERVKRDSHLNVLLVTLDTTRADRIGCYGYGKARTPHIDSLASAGVRFSNAYCQVPLTSPSHCSILTGTYPVYHRVHNNGTYYLSPDMLTLAEVLKDRGFETAAFVASFTVDSRFGLDQGFDYYDDKFSEEEIFKALHSERKADKVAASFSGWLDKKKAQQFFCWVHFYDPHLPYDPPSPFKEEFSDRPYDGEIAYMDSSIGQIIEKLKEKNLFDKTLIVLAGDHGEALGEKKEFDHGIFLYDVTMKVPLVFCAGGHLPRGKTIESRVRLVDVMPSVLDILNIPVNKEAQGISLLPVIEGKKKEDLSTYIETYYPRENFGWSELVGLVDGDWKYIQAPKEELYNLKKDPGEKQNAVLDEREVASDKKKKLKEFLRNFSSGKEAEKREMTAEEKERLSSLGYISFAEGPSGKPLPDPKDRIDEFRMIHQAKMVEYQKNYPEAARIFEKILAQRPDTPSSYVNLALVYAEMNNFDRAIAILERGTERIPGSVTLLARLGHTYLVAGKLQQALKSMKSVLEIDPQYFDAVLASARILDSIGENEDASSYYEKALKIEPENKFLRKSYAYHLATSGRIPEAIESYNSLKKDYPEDYEVYQYLGIAYGSVGNFNESITHLKKAISLHPSPLAFFNLAVALKKTGNLKEAIQYMKLYLENAANEDEARIKQAQRELTVWEKLLKQ